MIKLKNIKKILFIILFLFSSFFFIENVFAEEPTSDERILSMWGFYNDDHSVFNSWDLSKGQRSDGKRVIVAVIDDGFDVYHEDLAGNTWKRIQGSHVCPDDIGHAEIEDLEYCCYDWNGELISNGCTRGGYDVFNSDYDPSHNAGEFHGTHVGGIIGAVTDNVFGIPGITPNIEIMPLRIADNEGVYDIAAIVNAILFAINNGANIINMSLGGAWEYPSIKDAIEEARDAEVLVVAAAGNDPLDNDKKWYRVNSSNYYNEECVWKRFISGEFEILYDHSNDCTGGEFFSEHYHYPSSTEFDNILSVAALCPPKKWVDHSDDDKINFDINLRGEHECFYEDSDDENKSIIANFSSYGKETVDVGAPGVGILSTLPSDLTYLELYSAAIKGLTRDHFAESSIDPDGKPEYYFLNGTSMAAPYVSGVAALVWAVNENLTSLDVKKIIMDTAIETESLVGKVASEGRINAFAAVKKAYAPNIDSLEIVDSTGSLIEDSPETLDFFIKIKAEDGSLLDDIEKGIVVEVKKNGHLIKRFYQKYGSTKESAYEYTMPFSASETGRYSVSVSSRSQFDVEENNTNSVLHEKEFIFDENVLLPRQIESAYMANLNGFVLPENLELVDNEIDVKVVWDMAERPRVKIIEAPYGGPYDEYECDLNRCGHY